MSAFTCLLLLSGLGLVAASAPASATSTTLCTGYSACARAGMSASGYAANRYTMWWRMYTGHNCTNYAAYRMVSNGMPNERPWSGGGNARYWGTANASITDDVPAVGAVAWWDAYVRPAGSAGHVAYVEQVISPDEIVISQDSWGGDFSWARITREGGSWPSGFIHFNDVALENTAPPVVSGTTRVGGTLTATSGTWTAPDLSYSYQWRAGKREITGATAPVVQLTSAEEGKKISVRVTAEKAGYPVTTVASPKTTAIQPGEITAITQPAVTGEAEVDSTLTASAGSWSPEPTGVTYQWSADGTPLEGATGASLVPGAEEIGKALTVTVTATKEGYNPVASTSLPTGAVAPGTFTVSTPPTVTGTPRLGETLRADAPGFTPTGDVGVQWYRGGTPVPGATSTTYAVTAADLGERLSARMTLSRPGYTTREVSSSRTARVKTPATLDVRTHNREHRLRLRALVDAPGVDDVAGMLRITFRGEVVKQVPVRAGTATTVLRGLPPGARKLKVRFVSTRSIRGATWRDTVRVR